MTLVDSHCHPQYLIGDDYDIDTFVKDTDTLHSYLMVSVIPEDIKVLVEVSRKSPKAFYSIGIHPSHAHEYNFNMVKNHFFESSESLVALGETGLDYYHTKEYLAHQDQCFHSHCELALEYNLPIIIHTREAGEDTLAILRQYPGLQGVIHCFTETQEFARKALDLGYYISFSGIITFKNAYELRDVVKYTPVDRILSETDAPFLSPVPHRGKKNHPCHVRYVVEEISRLKSMSIDDLEIRLLRNTQKLFKKMRY